MAKSIDKKIKEAKTLLKFRKTEVKESNTNRDSGDIAHPAPGVQKVTTPKTRTKEVNALNSAYKTAGRASNIESRKNAGTRSTARRIGGITGAGAAAVSKVYRNMGN